MSTPFDPKTICPFWDDPEFQEAWANWWRCPARKRCSTSPRAVKMALTRIKTFAGNDMKKAIAILDRSAYKGYSDVYDIVDYSTNGENSELRYPDPEV